VEYGGRDEKSDPMASDPVAIHPEEYDLEERFLLVRRIDIMT
jgi:hypothetical protein